MNYNLKKKLQAYNVVKGDPTLKWDIGEELGKGSYATVYLAKRKTDNQTAAIKSATLSSPSSLKEDLEDLLNEIKIMQSCDCENVIKFYEAYQQDGESPLIHLLLEYCDGKTLGTVIETMVEVSEAQIKAVMYQTICGIQHLHSRFIIHRDIKSLNILLTSTGDVKLADFGVSAICQPNKMVCNTFVGSLNWMAPEILQCYNDPALTYDEKSDLWSAGIVVIEMAEMRVPFSQYHKSHIIHALLNHAEPRLSCQSIWSKEIKDFIEKTVIKNKNQRLCATDCLSHPFLNNDEARSKALVMELLSLDVNETVEMIDFDLSELPTPCENLASNSSLSHSESSAGDMEMTQDESSEAISNSTCDKGTESEPQRTNSVSKPTSNRALTKSVRKTVKYRVNGEEKVKTFTEIHEEGKSAPAENRYARFIDQDLREFKNNVKLEQKQRKMADCAITAMREDLEKRLNPEKMHLLEKIRKELDNLQRANQKEIDKWICANETTQIKKLKKLRGDLESQKKSVHEKFKQQFKDRKKELKKNKDKYNKEELENQVMAEEEEQRQSLQQQFKKDWQDFLTEQRQCLDDILSSLISARAKKANELEIELWQCEIQQMNERYKTEMKCSNMSTNLAITQLLNRFQQELAWTKDSQTKSMEELTHKQAKEAKNMPKILKAKMQQNLVEFRKNIKSSVSGKSERKELLECKSKDEEVKYKNDLADMHGNHASEMESLRNGHQKEMEELKQLQRSVECMVLTSNLERHQKAAAEAQKKIVELLSSFRIKKAEVERVQREYSEAVRTKEIKNVPAAEFAL